MINLSLFILDTIAFLGAQRGNWVGLNFRIFQNGLCMCYQVQVTFGCMMAEEVITGLDNLWALSTISIEAAIDR
jgi:hypothetical protein